MSQKRWLVWTPELDARLLHLRNVEKINWEAIGAELGWSRTACHVRYLKITNPDQRVKGRELRRTWTEEGEADVFRMRFTDKMTITEIAIATQRTAQSISSKLERLTNGPRARIHFERPHSKIVPQSVIDDRNRRMTAERDLTAEFFGDPEPGRSALDRRQLAGASA